jgi:UDPglucose--hexose-1-phosphate uridylyltransferase
MGIRFESAIREAHILSPLRNFELVTQTIEHRTDPLTGRRVIVLKGRMDYVKKFIESDQRFADELAQATSADCPFCPNAALEKAPKFIPQISPEGRIQVGEAICFPSLFAHQDCNAVVVPTHSHELALNQFSLQLFVDGFMACTDYFDRIRKCSPDVKYAAILMNFYPPAGSTVAHAHMHALASDIAFQAVTQLLEKSKVYRSDHNSSYWLELIETERRARERYLGSIEGVHWLTPFSPMGLNEAQAVVPEKSSLDQLSKTDLAGLAQGIVKVLRFYHDIGVRSFNLALYSGPLGEPCDYFSVNLRIVSRYGYKPRFVSDVWAMQYLLGDQEVYESPEETCARLRNYFR